MLIVDSSVILAAVLPDEASHYAERVLERLEMGVLKACVPAIFYLEVTNVIAMTRRRGRLTESEARDGLETIRELPLIVDMGAADSGKTGSIYRLMETHHLTAYDAAYLELAVRKDYMLATLDKSLEKASRKQQRYYLS